MKLHPVVDLPVVRPDMGSAFIRSFMRHLRKANGSFFGGRILFFLFAVVGVSAFPVQAQNSAQNSAQVSAEDSIRLRHQVELFADLLPSDTIVAARAVAPDTLELQTRGGASGLLRTSRYFVPASMLSRMVVITVSQEPDLSEESTGYKPEPLSQARLRQDYLGGQLTASTYIYGIALVNGLQLEGDGVVILPIFALTGSMAAHAVFSLNHPLNEGQVLGMNYVSGASILTSYALPYIILGGGSKSFRVGSLISLAAYPASLWPGYMYGNRYRNHPWDLNKKVSFALAFGAAGAFLPFVYQDSPSSDQYLRTIPLYALGFGAAGHFAADLYRPGEPLTEGVTTGISSHTALGALIGTAVAAHVDADDSRVWTGLILGSAVAGYAEGLWFFHDRNDNADVANYSSLGLGGGLGLMGAMALVMDASFPGTMTMLAIGGTLGYTITYKAMRARGAREGASAANDARNGFVKGVSLSFAPVTESVQRAPGERPALRYRVPGVTVRF